MARAEATPTNYNSTILLHGSAYRDWLIVHRHGAYSARASASDELLMNKQKGVSMETV